MNIGKSIKFVRVAANLKQGDMAQRLGITQNYLSLIENNKTEPSLSLLKKISDEFNVPISFLITEATASFESPEPETDKLYKELHHLIHELQKGRIQTNESEKDKLKS